MQAPEALYALFPIIAFFEFELFRLSLHVSVPSLLHEFSPMTDSPLKPVKRQVEVPPLQLFAPIVDSPNIPLLPQLEMPTLQLFAPMVDFP